MCLEEPVCCIHSVGLAAVVGAATPQLAINRHARLIQHAGAAWLPTECCVQMKTNHGTSLREDKPTQRGRASGDAAATPSTEPNGADTGDGNAGRLSRGASRSLREEADGDGAAEAATGAGAALSHRSKALPKARAVAESSGGGDEKGKTTGATDTAKAHRRSDDVKDGRRCSPGPSDKDADRKRPRHAPSADADAAVAPKATKHSAIDFVQPEPMPAKDRMVGDSGEGRAVDRHDAKAPVRATRGRGECVRPESDHHERSRRAAK